MVSFFVLICLVFFLQALDFVHKLVIYDCEKKKLEVLKPPKFDGWSDCRNCFSPCGRSGWCEYQQISRRYEYVYCLLIDESSVAVMFIL